MRIENDRGRAKFTLDPLILPSWALPAAPPDLQGRVIAHQSIYDMKAPLGPWDASLGDPFSLLPSTQPTDPKQSEK